MSDQRVYMSLLISDRYKVINNSVQGFGGDDDSMPDVSLVVCPVRGLLRAYVGDEEAADAHAKREGAVMVSWSADTDHRGEVTA